MQIQTILYIVLAGIIALLLALFQYYKKNEKSMFKLNMLFSVLRFISVFSVLVLIINPQFNKTNIYTEKANLIIATDNSKSVKFLKQDQKTLQLLKKLASNQDLNSKFNIQFYNFGETLNLSDSLDFSENQTNISSAFNQLNKIYRQTTAPTILITDGNQTYGNDYQFVNNNYKHPIYPIVLGDTLTYTDLKIEQLNVNKYAYLNNKFPVEVILVYNGKEQVSSNFTVSNNGRTVYSSTLKFSEENNSKVLNFTIPANSVGFSNYKATISPIENEKNTVNNTKNFAVDVINEKTKIAIVSDIIHPDIGLLKKSIETNKQREIVILKPNEFISQINDFKLVILNQPNNSFKSVFEVVKKNKINKLVIVGSKTDLFFLNNTVKEYEFEITNQTENYQAQLNSGFSPFIVSDIEFESFPPLLSNYSSVIFNTPYQVLLNKTLNGVSINEPLIATIENDKQREVLIFGENIWQWRAQSFLNTKSFNDFDDFIGKLIQFLNTNQQRSRLNIDYNSFYNSGTNIIVKAEYFDKNFVFDTRETINITVVDEASNEQKTYPFVLKNNNYQVDLSNLSPGSYKFNIQTSTDKLTKSGRFEILDYNVEEQFLSANVTKLRSIATNSNGEAFFMNNTDNLISTLVNDERFTPIQKSKKETLPLIDWKILLAIIALSLSAEWFLRKYNGLT
ncbi:VWA domain-containing protein [Neotamlana laminarinivorans]|uniref:VWA domain-containing protein n=1 Tax=Neotamlana laminarinivorans TaxID=2883124 RepID=A0A9X1HXF1_9FLAO|nr:VWA domain-containing protein [Tamlana laminarinivorans]MCB4797665.1 VWA domain-containing protein [Tamlana laminarinivorans]